MVRHKVVHKKLVVFIFINIIIIATTSLAACSHQDELTTEFYLRKQTDDGPEAREGFSPRVDYNEWMPVGRGDPLKNDPTYDYSPPVLNRVRYWASDANRHEISESTQSVATSTKESHDNKNEILLLGIPSKRQSYRKETKYQPKNTVRRSYYVVHHNLPTRLMPPPMQTIPVPLTTSSSTTLLSNKQQLSTTESVQKQYNNPNHHHATSNNPYNSINAAVSSSSLLSGSSSHHQNPTWGYNKYPYDTRPQESMNYISITRPDVPPAIATIQKPNTVAVEQLSKQQPHFKRKPWIHELLQKEIAPKIPSFNNHVVNLLTKPQILSDETNQHHQYHQFYQHSTTMTPITFTSMPHHQPQPQPQLTELPPMMTMRTPPVTTPTTNQPNPTYFEPTITPTEMPMTTDSIFSHYKQPGKLIHGPMYLIIEGHSNVKTYGLKDNDTKSQHMPKIRPVSVKDEDAIIKHVVLQQDDNGQAMEIKHLHNKPNVESNLHLKENLIEKDDSIVKMTLTSTSTSKSTSSSTSSTTEKTSSFNPISNLFNLFDTSFGGFFSNETIKSNIQNLTTDKPPQMNQLNLDMLKPEKLIDNREPLIFVTTIQPILTAERKESRQNFDYDDDQMTESSLFDFFNSDYDDDYGGGGGGGGQTENILLEEPKNLMDSIK